MRAWLRLAGAGIVAVALLPFGGLEPESDATPIAGGTPATRPAPAEVRVAGTTGPTEPSASPSLTAGPSASPPPASPAAVSPSPATRRSPTRAPTNAAAAKAPATKVAAPAPPAAPDNVASRLHTIPAGTRQLIVVYSNGYGTSSATIETFNKVNDVWQPAFGAMSGRIGSKGFSGNHVEGDLTTPTGVYSIGATMYGIDGNPGVRYGYHQLVADDYWDENPDSPTYNSFVHGNNPGAGSEALWQVAPQYDYFAVINYNTPAVPASPPRGSAIFLHVRSTGGTAGCVALGQSDLVRVLDWLDPAASPRIVMAPSQDLGRY